LGLIVVDASVMVDLLAVDDVHRHKATRERLTSSEAVFAPAYLDIEVVAALHGLARRNDVLAASEPALIERWLQMPIRRMPLAHAAADRIWQLRANMTAYDAVYVALADQLTASLITCDRKYLGVPGLCCAVELLS
jgi:predicted nucleic acid-binding protein